MAVAAAAAAVVSAIAVAALSGRGGLGGAPGPLPLPHRRAALTCSACHKGGQSVAAACTGCHGPHRSTRAPHQKLAASGQLTCADCHSGHGDNGGVVFASQGSVVRYGPGGEELVTGAPRYRPRADRGNDPRTDRRGDRATSTDVIVPLVAVRACSRCHDPTSPRDAVRDCLIAGQDALGPRRATVCFDEHRPAGRESGAAAARSAAWEAAREVAGLAPLAPAAAAHPILTHAALWLLLAAGAAAAAWALRRALDRDRRAGRRERPARGAAVAGSPATPVGSSVTSPGMAPATAAIAALPTAAPRPTLSAVSSPATAIVAAPRSAELPRLPTINTSTCLGCHACVDACPYDVLDIRRYVAVVARPADCCGLTLCEQRCPNGSLIMAERSPSSPAPESTALPLTDDFESRDVPGLFVAGDLTGLGLIRNAVNQGALAVRAIAAAAARGRPRPDGALDVLIIGAGPAGLSAALEAQALGLRHLALEQGSVAESIRSFPRGKLVLDPDLPQVGRLWLAEATKEELLARWLRIVRREQPAIREGQRVTAIERDADGFAVASTSRDGDVSVYRAARLLLAIGRRGTPRLLPVEVPPGWADRVHYSLADARSFAGRRVLVVGLGDVAMEAAVALSRQPGTDVTVSCRAADFTRGKARNIAELRRRMAAGAVRVLWQSEIRAFTPAAAMVWSPEGLLEIQCDALLVFIGSIPSAELIGQAGIAPRETGWPAGSLKPDEPARRADRPEETRA